VKNQIKHKCNFENTDRCKKKNYTKVDSKWILTGIRLKIKPKILTIHLIYILSTILLVNFEPELKKKF
jgi:hypothetical protein